VTVGTELGRLREINASALILAGLLSAVLLPAAAGALLGGTAEVPATVAAAAEPATTLDAGSSEVA
jgi:hypothetical protein